MIDLLTPYFLNPLAAAVGIGLISVPILIHLINRLRYRTVEFAAMEFLLQSQQQNRRRVFLEQLLLLLLRILIVVLATLLIGRLVLSASQLALFRGATLHQVVVLDDSLSSASRVGNATAFDRGLDYVSGLVGDGETNGTTNLTVYRASRPAEPIVGLSERRINGALANELELLLGDLRASHQSPDWAAVLERIGERIESDPETVTTLHLVTDGRQRDWSDAESLSPMLEKIEDAGGRITFVRTVEEPASNLTLAGIVPGGATAAVGVPMPFAIELANGGPEATPQTAVAIRVDGQELPSKVEFEPIEPGESATRTAEVIFETAGSHEVTAVLPVDDLEYDNSRSLAIDVPVENPVLIVDGNSDGTSGRYVADALGSDRSLTGFAPIIVTPDALRRTPVENYQAIYLIDIGRLDSETTKSLRSYVEAGGGVIWFMGEQSRQLASQPLGPEGAFLLPGTIEPPADLPDADEADIVAGDHPIFRILGGTDNPFLDVVDVARYSPIGNVSDDAQTLATLRNGEPLVIAHPLGAGRIVTVLTAAGSQPDDEGVSWNNWAGGPGAPSFAVFALELQQFVAKRASQATQMVGQPIEIAVPVTEYRESIEVIDPNGLATGLKATPSSNGDGEQVLTATYDQTDTPGVYRIELQPQSTAPGDTETRLVATQVVPSEGQLALVDGAALLDDLAALDTLTVQQPDDIDRLSGQNEGRGGLLRTLVVALVILLVAEQALAYRMGYHNTAAS